MSRSTTEWLWRWLRSPWVMPVLGIASFLESIIVPIPLETILLPLMQKRREVMWWLALVALAGCVAGAAVGYVVGYAFMETAGSWFIDMIGKQDALEQAKGTMQSQGFWFIMMVSVSPMPFQIAMLAAGATNYTFALFMLATTISRGLRYFGMALLVWWLGDRAESWMKRNHWKTVAVVVVIVVACWGVARLV